jgi:TonB family protein
MPGRAQEDISTVEQLYAAAFFREALAVLDRSALTSGTDTLEAAEYKILCLFALEEVERAHVEIEKLLLKFPKHQPSPVRFSPQRRQQFEEARRRVLPRILRTRYAEARASFEAKRYEEAVQRFTWIRDVLQHIEHDPPLTDVRTLASGFLDLSRAAASEAGTIYDESSAEVVPPVALTPILPPISADVSVAIHNQGLFEIVVDESGGVESFSVRRSVRADYDALVLEGSRNWRFKPATRKGQPVKFRKTIEMYAVPLASSRR